MEHHLIFLSDAGDSIFSLLVTGTLTGLFPLMLHCVLFRLTGRWCRWTRWVVPVLAAAWLGNELLSSMKAVPSSYAECYTVLSCFLMWEGILLLSTRHMERNSK